MGTAHRDGEAGCECERCEQGRAESMAEARRSYRPDVQGTSLHVIGGEWEYDEACDCPRCSDFRDAHCINCGEPHVWHGRDEADRNCPSCRTRAGEWDHEDDWKPGR